MIKKLFTVEVSTNIKSINSRCVNNLTALKLKMDCYFYIVFHLKPLLNIHLLRLILIFVLCFIQFTEL